MTAGAIAWLLAALAAAGALVVSRRSLLRPASHGFYRLFAFLAILALVALALPRWFERPLSGRQLLSWVLLVGAIHPAIRGLQLLRGRGRPAAPDPGTALLAFENTSILVTDGIYRRIRHPMYASLLALAWGVALKAPGLPALALALAASAALFATARAEEVENLARFGAGYRAYMARTRRFVPFLF